MPTELIKLHLVLSELDESILPNGKKKTFSIAFISKDGERIYMNRSVKTGLNMNLKKNAMRGVLAVNMDGDIMANAHPTPVWIWGIVEFNGRRVII